MKDKIDNNEQQMASLKKVTKDDAANAWKDEFGVFYSADKTRLLRAPKNISEYSIPEGTEIICDWAFGECESLRSIKFSNSLIAIGFRAFHECFSLKTIVIPGSVKEIDTAAFFSCDSLQTATILEGVEIIGNEAFNCCSSLQSIDLPNSLMRIGDWAFAGCGSLKSFSIPSSVTHIGKGVFELCDCHITNKSECFRTNGSDLYSVKDKILLYCSPSLNKYNIPDSLSIIGDCAFFDCTKLKSIVLPDSITKIEWLAFGGCKSLSTVKLSKSLKEIGDAAFSGCSSLKSIILPESLISIDKGAFSSCDSLTIIYVPKGASTRFKELLCDYTGKIIEIADQDGFNCNNEFNDDKSDYDEVDNMMHLIPGVFYKKTQLEEQWRNNHWYYYYPSVRDYVKSLAYGEDVKSFFCWLFEDARLNSATAWSLPPEYDIALEQFFNLFYDLED